MSRRRGRFMRKKQSKLDETANKVKKLEKKIGTIAEVSTAGSVVSTDVFSIAPVIDLITATGDGLKTRITSALVRGTIKRNVDSALIDDYRVDLVLDREPNKTEVTPLVLYGTATPPIGAYKNVVYKRRFKILRTHMGTFDESGNGRGGDIIDWYVKLNLVAESATANSWAQAAVTKNAIYLIYWTTAAANPPIPNLQSRLYCMDSNA